MAKEIIDVTPPYPGEGATLDNMYKYLGDLRAWVLAHRDGLNAAAGRELIIEPRPLPAKSAYAIQPISYLAQHFLVLRRIREAWDDLIRRYEDDWNDKHCVRARIVLVQVAAIQVNEAFVPPEVREARQEEFIQQLQRSFEAFNRRFEEMLNGESDEPEPTKKPRKRGK